MSESRESTNHDFDELVGGLLDGRLTDDDIARLNVVLAERRAQERFVELCKLHYCLAEHVLSESTKSLVATTELFHKRLQRAVSNREQLSSEELLAICQQAIAADSRRQIGWWAVAAVAASVFIAAMWWKFGLVNVDKGPDKLVVAGDVRDDEPPADSNSLEADVDKDLANERGATFVGRIVAMSEDTKWHPDSIPNDYLLRLKLNDRLRLIAGRIKLEFGRSAVAIVDAPADLELTGDNSVALYHGVLSGRSETGQLIVTTPQAEVIDIGTLFRVDVSGRQATEVSVLEGEVHVKRPISNGDTVRLTAGMAARIEDSGIRTSHRSVEEFPDVRERRPEALKLGDISFVDIVSGSAPDEYRLAGAIDPDTGRWDTLPWSEQKGVPRKIARGRVVEVSWNPWVHSIFVPDPSHEQIAVDLLGGIVPRPQFSGGAWGPVWARRRLEATRDPLASVAPNDVESFWGEGTTTALLERTKWTRDGIVGLHANVGLTIDLDAIRAAWACRLDSFGGKLAHLEESHISQPFHPDAGVDVRMFVDGHALFERAGFSRRDGDVDYRVSLPVDGRFLTILVTDSGDGPIYDRLVLLDPVLYCVE